MTLQQIYSDVIAKTDRMVESRTANMPAAKHRLGIVNVAWEDTGRYKGFAVGPNISEMTIQVQDRLPDSDQYRLTCMPVIRYPNLSDTGHTQEEAHKMVDDLLARDWSDRTVREVEQAVQEKRQSAG
jgi:hypothetical protein